MKQIEFIQRIIGSLQFSSPQEFNKYLGLFLGGVLLTGIGSTYYIYARSSALAERIKTIQELSKRSSIIMNKFDHLQEEEDKLSAVLEQHKDFAIRTFFEQFCKQNNLTPEPSWGDSVETNQLPLYPDFEEEIIRPVFKNQTTQTMLQLFQALEKEPMATVKDVTLTVEGTTLTAHLTIAGKKHVVAKKSDE